MLATGFSFDPAVRRRQGEIVATLLPRIRDVRRSGAASIDLCALATGAVDGYFEAGLGPWDVAAGIAIAQASGATVIRSSARGGAGVAVIGSNSGLLPSLTTVLADAGFQLEEPRGGEP
jgi:myo-inositol-1(or 4)-monophosphatase